VHNHLNHAKELEELVIVEEDDIFFGQIVLVNDVIISTLKNISYNYLMVTLEEMLSILTIFFRLLCD